MLFVSALVIAFMVMGIVRATQHQSWQLAFASAALIALVGIGFQLENIAYAIRHKGDK